MERSELICENCQTATHSRMPVMKDGKPIKVCPACTCDGCGGFGEVGGLMPDPNGYHSEACSACLGTGLKAC